SVAVADAWCVLGAAMLAEPDKAIVRLERAIEVAGAIDSPAQVATARMLTGHCAFNVEAIDQAIERFESAIQVAERCDADLVFTSAHINLALCLTSYGDVTGAAESARLGIERARQFGHNRLAALGHKYLGMLALSQGDIDHAIAEFERSTRELLRCGNIDDACFVLHFQALAQLARQRTWRADAVFRRIEMLATNSTPEI